MLKLKHPSRSVLVPRVVVALALACVPPVQARGDFILSGSDLLIVQSSEHAEGTMYDNSRLHLISGRVYDLYAWDASAADIYGGTVDTLQLNEGSSVHVHDGGWVTELYAYDNSAVAVSDGWVSELYAYDNSAVDCSSGSVGRMALGDASTVDISGGWVGTLYADDNSAVDLSGGTVGFIHARGDSTVTFDGWDFQLGAGLALDGDRLLGVGLLAGRWETDRWYTHIVEHDPSATIRLIPEPATLWLLALGGLGVLPDRRNRRRGQRCSGAA